MKLFDAADKHMNLSQSFDFLATDEIPAAIKNEKNHLIDNN